MDLGLKGRTAFVVGSTAGLGLAIAKAIGSEGANVVLTGRRARLAAEEARSLPSAIGVELDLERPETVDAALSNARESFGEIDVLVLNGGGPAPGPASELTPERLEQATRTLLTAQVRLANAVLPAMRAAGWGRILAIGSSGVQQPIPNLASSNIARAGLAGYLKTLANEVAADGVTVNMILPGRIATDRVAGLDARNAESAGVSVQEIQSQSERSIPAGRYGRAAEFADVAAFLCSDRASYVVGAQIRVDGGLIRAL